MRDEVWERAGRWETPRGREPRRQALSQELPRESGSGIYESLVPIKKTLCLECSGEDHHTEPRPKAGGELALRGTILSALRPDSGLRTPSSQTGVQNFSTI